LSKFPTLTEISQLVTGMKYEVSTLLVIKVYFMWGQGTISIGIAAHVVETAKRDKVAKDLESMVCRKRRKSELRVILNDKTIEVTTL
jgi:hypothetical protein